MRILYAALRHDPTNPDLASGVDYNFYSAFVREGAEVKVAGPFTGAGSFPERVFKRLYVGVTGKRYLKWNLRITQQSARGLNLAEAAWCPDVVFGIFPPPFAFYRGRTPFVFNTDTTLQGMQDGGAGFGASALRFMTWLERRTVRRSARVITFSEWCKSELVRRHGISREKVVVHPMPAALPREMVPKTRDFVPKDITSPLRLLLVGREYERKGIPVAIEVARQLNSEGIPAELTICGLSGPAAGSVRFAGLFRKSVPSESAGYAQLYQQNHLLIHPATFDPSPIVPAEAAAFGMPTVSNDVGGIATSVADGVSGIVLRGHSPADAYVEAITGLVRNPIEFTRLSVGARNRYEQEQNWDVAGKRVMQWLEEVAGSRRN